MAVQVMALVWDSDVPAPERFTLLALADRSDEEGKCWPSVRWLARKCQMSSRTIRRHLAWLEAEHLIRRAVRANDSNVYRIQMGTLAHRKLPDTPRQVDTPDNLSPLTDETLTPDRRDTDPCQVVTQSVIDTSGTSLSSGNAALLPDVTVEPDVRRADVEALCIYLRDRIMANGSKAPTITKQWRTQARLLLDRDERDPDEVRQLIDWCQDDDFWRSNILSMPKFRMKYDQLRLRAQSDRPSLRALPDPAVTGERRVQM